MCKKAATYFGICILAVMMLTGCKNNKTEEPIPTDKTTAPDSTVEMNTQSDETTSSNSSDYGKISLFGDLSSLVGTVIDPNDEEFQMLKYKGSFQCTLSSNKKVVSITTIDPSYHIHGISPQLSLETAITYLLRDQWSYKAEYFWYSELPDDTNETPIACFQSAVFEKDHYEYVITINAEENYDEICAVELIDTDLYEDNVDSTNETVFAHLHELI